MPGGFYWDAILFMVLAGAGLVWSLYTHSFLHLAGELESKQ